MAQEGHILTVDEVAKYLRMNRITVYRLAQQGKIPAVKVGRHWRFRSDLIEEWLHQRGLRPRVRILVVDDEAPIGELFRRILQEGGYTVMTALRGEEGLQLMRRYYFDLIFLDLKMPEMDGVETFRRIREMDPRVPVVIITGYPDSELMDRAMQYGVFAIMRKPFGATEVLHTVEGFVGQPPRMDLRAG